MASVLDGKPSVISKEINSSTDSGTNAKIVYEIVGNDGITYRLTVNLVRDGGDWKILNFESKHKS